MTERRTYEGQCHCGAVRYRATTDLGGMFDCNCSRCRRIASVMSAVPASDFTLLSGEDNLTLYRFNHHAIEHLFCKTCGVQSFSRGKAGDTAMVMLNVGCLEGAPMIDRAAITHYNGADS
ncbi:MAG TPA: GFA family protein [Devosia sp.]